MQLSSMNRRIGQLICVTKDTCLVHDKSERNRLDIPLHSVAMQYQRTRSHQQTSQYKSNLRSSKENNQMEMEKRQNSLSAKTRSFQTDVRQIVLRLDGIRWLRTYEGAPQGADWLRETTGTRAKSLP
jgi:hypothetical protein